ncbi:MAG TPA: nucleotidyl transferase AbiEii/AbiGii toxin family protein [Thermoanaerobaculia bacterium]|nr:nucleotidyl transferase AbiEii/AbiGii toxin family protein [Thermoanaerobaculia bacterium]
MDEPGDREYSRAPEVSDVTALCRSLNAAAARYVLIGGFAVILNGAVRTTKDIDLLVDPAPDNVGRLRSALSSLPDRAVLQVEDSDVDRYGVVRVADEVVVDLMASACGVRYQDAIAAGIDERTIDGVTIPVASRGTLIRTKQTFRDSDRADVAFLKRLIDAEKSGR